MISRRSAASTQRGVALAVVVWFLAGMSLLVAGIVAGSRGDVRLARLHAEKAQVTAAADGAITLLMADLLDGYFNEGGRPVLAAQRYDVGERSVSVVAVPVNWLVDPNAASLSLLTSGVAAAAEIPPERARELAEAVVQWRSARSEAGRPQRFGATEDLLGVAGMDRATLDSVRDFLAEPSAGSGLSEAGAPSRAALQAALALSPPRRVAAAGSGGVGQQVGAGVNRRSSAYRVDAIVEMGGKHWLRRRWIDPGQSGRGVPWRHVRTEPARVIGT